MIKNILKQIFNYLFNEEIESIKIELLNEINIYKREVQQDKINLTRNFEKQTKLLETEIRNYFIDYLDNNKYKIKQLITKKSIEKGISEVAEKEINTRGLACAIDFGIKGDDTQVILIGNNKGKHFVKSYNLRVSNIYQLNKELDRITDEYNKIQRGFIDSGPMNIHGELRGKNINF